MNIREFIIFGLSGQCGHDLKRLTSACSFIVDEPPSERVILERFSSIFEYARQQVPYYNQKFKHVFAPQSLYVIEAIRDIPCITREEIIRHSVLSRQGRPVTSLESGGTTGGKIKTHLDLTYLLDRYGSLLRILYALGWTMGEPIAALHPEEYRISRYLKTKEIRRFIFEAFLQYAIYRLFHNRVNIYYGRSCFSNVSPHNFKKKIERLGARLLITRPDILLAWIKQLSGSSELPAPVPVVLCVGNILTASAKALVEEMLGCSCHNMYASTEMGYVGLSCKHSGEWVHIDEDNYFVEIDTAGSSEIIITDFRNRAMPLIRYRTGDVGNLQEGFCPCGRKGKSLKVLGRVNRFILNERGERVYESGIVDIISTLPGVSGLQIRKMPHNQLTVRMRSFQSGIGALDSLAKALGVRRESLSFDPDSNFLMSDSGKFPYIC